VYGHFVEVLFYKKLRNEVEFDSLCALRTAIEEDVQQTQHFFAEHNRRNL
jgi:FAD synthase